jgi:hypothetical protein
VNNADVVGAINVLARGHRVLACGEPAHHVSWIDAKDAAPKAVKRPSLTRAYVEKHALPGESWEVARERLRAERGRA